VKAYKGRSHRGGCPHEEQIAASVGPEIKVDYEEATAKPFSLNFTELGCLFFLKLKICFA